jgi:hypothetical protein
MKADNVVFYLVRQNCGSTVMETAPEIIVFSPGMLVQFVLASKTIGATTAGLNGAIVAVIL